MSEKPTNPVAYAELQSNDPVRARAFYSELFGWKADEERRPPVPTGPSRVCWRD